jgi:hypothetical protein
MNDMHYNRDGVDFIASLRRMLITVQAEHVLHVIEASAEFDVVIH